MTNKKQKLFSWQKAKGCTIDCEIDLDELFDTREQRKRFEGKWKEFLASDPDNKKIYKKKGNRLIYKSEQLIPDKKDKRPPLFLVLGNPATHSVKSGVFFAFTNSGRESRFWKYILKPAGVLAFSFDGSQPVEQLNTHRRQSLFNLKYDSPFRIGLSVIISMPSAPGGKWGGVAGVQKLIGINALRKLEEAERYRILESARKFVTPKGVVVTFQKNAWNALKSADDPQYGLETARAGKLKGTLIDNPGIPLLCAPPTRLSGRQVKKL